MATPKPDCHAFYPGLEILVTRARQLDGFRAIHVELEILFRADPEEVWRVAQPLYQQIAGLPQSGLDEACLGLKRLMERMLRLEATNPQAHANLRRTLKDIADSTIIRTPVVRAEILQRIARAHANDVEGLDVLLNALRDRTNFRGTDYVLKFGDSRGARFANVKAVELDRAATGSGRGVDLEFKDPVDANDPYSPTHFEFKSGPDQDMSPKQSMLQLFGLGDWRRYRVVVNAAPDSPRLNKQAARLLGGASEGALTPSPNAVPPVPPELHMGLIETMKAHRNEQPWQSMIADLDADVGTPVDLDLLAGPFTDRAGNVLDTNSVEAKVLAWAKKRFIEGFPHPIDARVARSR